MVPPNNPAARLLDILRDVKKRPQNPPAKDVWADVLAVDKADISLLLQRLAHVIKLPALIRQEIERQPDINHNVFLKWLPKVEQAFSIINLNSNMTSFSNPIDEAALYGLEVCAELLSRKAPDKTLPEEELQRLEEEIKSIIDEVMSAEIDDYLRNYMLDKLDMVCQAAQLYRILGIKPLKRAFEATMGSLVVNNEMYAKVENTDSGKKFWKAMTRVALILNIALGSLQIANTTLSPPPKTLTAKVVQEDSCSDSSADAQNGDVDVPKLDQDSFPHPQSRQ